MDGNTERVDTVVIGGGQAGLAVGYYLSRARRSFVILDAYERVGDAWRRRWDSLRLFSPAGLDGLPGMKFPMTGWYFPTKDELADYLEKYAMHFGLPVRTGVRVTRVTRPAQRFLVESDHGRFEADHVVIASGHEYTPNVPSFARELDPRIAQLHSSEYQRPSQIHGSTLVVGAGNSGAEIALDLAGSHRTYLSGQLRRSPVGPSRSPYLTAVLWPIVSHLLTIDTPIGRRVRAKLLHASAPVERVTEKALATAGVERLPRTVGVRQGAPLLEDGRTLDVATVVWCTGYRTDLNWIALPIFDDEGEPRQRRGVVESMPGLYFVGRFFQYAFSSLLIGGVGRDAAFVVDRISRHAALREGGLADTAEVVRASTR